MNKVNGLQRGALIASSVLFLGLSSSASASESNLSTGAVLAEEFDQAFIWRAMVPISIRTEILIRQSTTKAYNFGDKKRSSLDWGNRGLSSGDAGNGFSAWSSVAYSSFENDAVATAYEGDSYSVTFGVDKPLTREISAGVSLGYDYSDTTSTFNAGGSEADSISFSPYVTYMINDTYSVDGSFGYTNTSTDVTRVTAGDLIVGTQQSYSTFVAVNFNASYWKDNWNLGWKVGYMDSRSNLDAFNETNITTPATIANASSDSALGQGQLGASFSYYTKEYQPYMSVTYERDMGEATSVDDDGFAISAGVSLFGSKGISGGLGLNTVLGRKNTDNYTLSANISIPF